MKKLHNNKPQQHANALIVKIMLLLFGRRTGKTSGVGVPKLYKNMLEMPRSRGFWGNPSYTNLYRNTLPEILGNLQNRFGMKEGVHFLFREKPPASFQRAYRPSTDYKNTFFLKNGSECNFFSLNFNVINNGDAADYGILDEVRFMNQDTVNNLLLCLSGTNYTFLNNPYHKGLLMMTDMPTHDDGDWLFEYEKDMNNEILDDIINAHYFWQEWRQKLKGDISESYRYAIQKKVDFYQEVLCKLSNLTTAVIEASTLDNVHVLGFDAIDNFVRLLPEHEFIRSVLNKRQQRTTDNFYYELSEKIHGYTAPKSSYIENLKFIDSEQNSNWDNDINYKLPIKMAMDYNSAICTMVCGQLDKNKRQLSFIKNLHVEKPLKRKHLVEKFNAYYKDIPDKTVHFYFDPTAIFTDADKDIDESYAQKTIQELEAFGWRVEIFYIEKPITHKWIFERWGELLRNELGIKFRWNTDNCRDWYDACAITKTKTRILENGRRKLEKDKGSEHVRSRTAPIRATHITEAGDILLKGVLLIDLEFSDFEVESDFAQVISS